MNRAYARNAKVKDSIALASILLASLFLYSFTSGANAIETKPLKTQRVLAKELSFPSAIEVLSDGRVLYSELMGKIRVIDSGILQRTPYAEITDVNMKQLLGLVLHPKFPDRPFLYLYHTYSLEDGTAYGRLVRFTDFVSDTGSMGKRMRVIIDGLPADPKGNHNGGVITFGPDGKLYLAIGDAGTPARAQDLMDLAGKILRINADGSIPSDNPFPNSPVFSYGHRNIFGLAFNPKTGQLFAAENGTDNNDEINIIVSGGNYGWPIVIGKVKDPRFVDPIYTFNPVIAPTNIAFSKRYCDTHDLYLGDYLNKSLRRLVLSDPEYDQVLSDEIVRTFGKSPIDVQKGNGGFIYVSTTTKIIKIGQVNTDTC